MALYRKKPVVIEAVQWNGENSREITAFCGAEITAFCGASGCTFDGVKLTVWTMGGGLNASIGDWIIKGVKGKFYPCKPDIFDTTYEAVE